MIDEKEVIEAIEEKILEVKADKEKCEVISDFADILMDVYRELIYFIKKQPRVGEWIPCSKQLPEMHKVPLDYDEYYMISDSVLVTDGNIVYLFLSMKRMMIIVSDGLMMELNARMK